MATEGGFGLCQRQRTTTRRVTTTAPKIIARLGLSFLTSSIARMEWSSSGREVGAFEFTSVATRDTNVCPRSRRGLLGSQMVRVTVAPLLLVMAHLALNGNSKGGKLKSDQIFPLRSREQILIDLQPRLIGFVTSSHRDSGQQLELISV